MKAPAFWYAPPGNAARLLSPAGSLFAALGRVRIASTRPVHPGVPVICIGNLVAGGAGKTPVALAVAEVLRSRRVHFLTRGYGGRERGPLQVDLTLGRDWPRFVDSRAVRFALLAPRAELAA